MIEKLLIIHLYNLLNIEFLHPIPNYQIFLGTIHTFTMSIHAPIQVRFCKEFVQQTIQQCISIIFIFIFLLISVLKSQACIKSRRTKQYLLRFYQLTLSILTLAARQITLYGHSLQFFILSPQTIYEYLQFVQFISRQQLLEWLICKWKIIRYIQVVCISILFSVQIFLSIFIMVIYANLGTNFNTNDNINFNLMSTIDSFLLLYQQGKDMAPKSAKTKAGNNNNNNNKVRSVIYNHPFEHLIVSNFLPEDLYKKAFEVYNKLQFKEKKTDLFNFFQTNELNSDPKFNFFKEELDKQFWELQPFKTDVPKSETFYNIFASYYFDGNYLLCHDDIVEDRIYAFSYYLEDHNSGDLVLFNSEANKQEKRINVRKNTLAIFKVSDISYHEVDYTKTDGRKAITGWINIKGSGSKRVQKTILPYVPCLPQPNNVLEYPLQKHHISEEYFQLMDIQYQFNVQNTKIEGPFYSRRVHKLQINPVVVFTLPGYKLYSCQFYHFKQGDYILLNDPVNTTQRQNQQVIDIFITHLEDDFETAQQDDDMLVKIVTPDDDPSGIPQIHDSLFVVKRGKKQYYVDRCENGKQFKLAHFIYKKEEKKKEQKKITKKAKAKIPSAKPKGRVSVRSKVGKSRQPLKALKQKTQAKEIGDKKKKANGKKQKEAAEKNKKIKKSPK